jgi:hypothetical protein
MADTRTWSLLSLEDGERQFHGNDGYDDVFGLRYSFNSRVPNSQWIQTGHVGVVRDGRQFLGWGIIHRVTETLGTAEVKRCPRCNQTGFKRRTTMTPVFRCSCSALFDDPVVEIAEARLYVAEFGDDWKVLTSPLLVSENELLYLSRAFQHAIREMHTTLWLERVSSQAS